MIECHVLEAVHIAQTSGDEKALEQARGLLSHVRALKVDGFQDIPLPRTEVSGEIKSFTDEEKKALAKEGLKVIYPFNGETIHDQKLAGRPFWYIAESESGSLQEVHAMFSEIAFDPRPEKFFLPKSNNSTLDQQREMIAEHSHKLQRKLKTESVEAVMGEAPNYTQLAFAHLDATGVRLFGKDYGFNYARTITPTVGTNVARVGGFDADGGLCVSDAGRDDRDSGVFASPLVVPK